MLRTKFVVSGFSSRYQEVKVKGAKDSIGQIFSGDGIESCHETVLIHNDAVIATATIMERADVVLILITILLLGTYFGHRFSKYLN